MFGFSSYFIKETEGLATVTALVHQLSNADLVDCFGNTILRRGRGYHKDGRLQMQEVEDEHITAKALGTRTYQTKVFIEGDTLQGQCNCPYEAACKHLAALLLEIMDLSLEQHVSGVKSLSKEGTLFSEVLEGKSKEALVEFLKKHATEAQRILLQQSQEPPISEAAFYELQEQIERLLQGKFLDDAKLKMDLDLLQPYWTKFPLKVAQLLYTTIGLLHDKIQQEGGFSHNYSTPYYHLDLDEYVANFLLQLPDQDLEMIFPAFWLMAVDTDLEDNLLQGLSRILRSNWEQYRSLKILKNIFLSDDLLEHSPRIERQQIFDFLRPALSKTQLLSYLKRRMPEEAYYLGLYAKALIEYHQIPQAIQLLDQQIKQQQDDPVFKRQGEEVYELRIELAQKHETDELAQTWCKAYLQNMPSLRSLEFAIQSFWEYRAWFETLIEERSVSVLLVYLQKNKRVIEAADLFNKYPKELALQQQAGSFYTLYKDQFPEKALKALEVTLKDHLNYTGDEAYRATAQVLLDIRSIEPKAAFDQRLTQIKEQFKRRRNMMAILEEFGL